MSAKPLAAILTVCGFLVGVPSSGWAACKYADGTAAPEPGFLHKATESKTWGPKFIELYGQLSKSDQSVVAGMVQDSGVAMTTKCSNHDLFWTHLSLVGWSKVVTDGIPPELQKIGRTYALTDEGRKSVRELLMTLAIMNQRRPL